MSSTTANNNPGLTLRQAALIAGFGYLLMPVSFAEFFVFPKLLIPGDIEQTTRNIVANGQLFGVAILCNLVTLILDVVICLGALCLARPGEQIVVIAYCMVPVGLYGGGFCRGLTPRHRLSPPDHTGVPDALWVRPAACPNSAGTQFVSI